MMRFEFPSLRRVDPLSAARGAGNGGPGVLAGTHPGPPTSEASG